MKHLISFTKTTIMGGIIFLIPFFIIVIVVIKAYEILRKIIGPLVTQFGIQHLLGKATVTLVISFILVLVCFLVGLLVRSGSIRDNFPQLDAMAIKMIPGYELLKAQSGESGVTDWRNTWQAIYLKTTEGWRIAFVVELNAGAFSTIFIPDAPKMETGQVKLVSLQSIEFLPLTVKQAHQYLGKFGVGASECLNSLKTEPGQIGQKPDAKNLNQASS
jgi:uncharacterized membrane protein